MPHWRFVRGLAEHWHPVRAEPSLVVPCEVGGTAEWAVSRPSPHCISSGDSLHSPLAVLFLLAFPLFYLFILHYLNASFGLIQNLLPNEFLPIITQILISLLADLFSYPSFHGMNLLIRHYQEQL